MFNFNNTQRRFLYLALFIFGISFFISELINNNTYLAIMYMMGVFQAITSYQSLLYSEKGNVGMTIKLAMISMIFFIIGITMLITSKI